MTAAEEMLKWIDMKRGQLKDEIDIAQAKSAMLFDIMNVLENAMAAEERRAQKDNKPPEPKPIPFPPV